MTSESPSSVREYLSPEERALPLEHTIDPGFVNRRLVQTVLGASGMEIIDRMVRSLPQYLSEDEQRIRVGHVYTSVLLKFCEINGVFTLGQILSMGSQARIFCSTEQVLACQDVYESKRV